jgi:Ion transport protein
MLITTFYALFADDFRLLLTLIDTDPYWDASTIIAIALFTTEIVLSCIAKYNYFLSYYFWLDSVSTASLFLDIILIKQQIVSAGNSSAFGVTKLGKIIRLVRLFRLIRISKIFKSFSKKDDSKKSKKKKS